MVSLKRKVGFLTIAFVLAIAFFFSLAALMRHNATDQSIVLDSQWVVDYHGQKSAPKSLAQFKPISGYAPYGDSLLLETTLPLNSSDFSFFFKTSLIILVLSLAILSIVFIDLYL